MLNRAHVIEITKACTVAFMKARKSFRLGARDGFIQPILYRRFDRFSL